MGFDIQRFKNTITPPLRNNKFMVRVSTPQGLRGTGFGKVEREMEFYAETVDIPGVNLMTHEIRRYGYGAAELKPYSPQFSPARIIYRGDQDGHVFRFLREWQGLAVNYQLGSDGISDWMRPSNSTPFEVGYKDSYASLVSIISYADDGREASYLGLVDAYPVQIGDVPMSWSMVGAYTQVPITLAFSRVRFL